MEDVYLDELWQLTQLINKRRLNDYKMQLAIVQNPHVKNPKELWKILQSMEKKPSSEKFDPAGFELLKSQLQKNPKFVVKS